MQKTYQNFDGGRHDIYTCTLQALCGPSCMCHAEDSTPKAEAAGMGEAVDMPRSAIDMSVNMADASELNPGFTAQVRRR